jgi:hypothetical protein
MSREPIRAPLVVNVPGLSYGRFSADLIWIWPVLGTPEGLYGLKMTLTFVSDTLTLSTTIISGTFCCIPVQIIRLLLEI